MLRDIHPDQPTTGHIGDQSAGVRRDFPAPGSCRWRDQLVDLHVLAASGDADAAATARRWLSVDAAARRAWDEVQRTCDRIEHPEDSPGGR